MRERFTGHISLGPLTIYGDNAMHWAWQLKTPWGYLCFRPTTGGGNWPWYLYLSPNATPWAATRGMGPGFRRDDRQAMLLRRIGECHCHVSNHADLCPADFHPIHSDPCIMHAWNEAS